jgi:hypothetical protein
LRYIYTMNESSSNAGKIARGVRHAYEKDGIMEFNETTAKESETFCSEEVFQRMLILERKRTERSGRPFLLMLLNVEELLKNGKRPKEVLIHALASSLNESTREIDVKGWYRRDSLVGVVCNEVGRNHREALIAKVKNKFLVFFDLPEVKLISMYMIDYPEYETHIDPNSPRRVIEELQPERRGMFYS